MFIADSQADNDKTISYETYQPSCGIYCIADNFCKEYELTLNKKSTFAFKSLSKYP